MCTNLLFFNSYENRAPGSQATRMEMGEKAEVSLPLCLAEELLQVRSTCVLCLPTRAAVTHCKYSRTAAEMAQSPILPPWSSFPVQHYTLLSITDSFRHLGACTAVKNPINSPVSTPHFLLLSIIPFLPLSSSTPIHYH